MPIYEYRCSECGHQEEFLQKVSEPPLTECPACRKPTFTKLVSAAGFQLKGSGWYVTDFRNKSSKPAEKKAEGSTQASAESKSDSKSGESKSGESKSEAPKTEAKPKSETAA